MTPAMEAVLADLHARIDSELALRQSLTREEIRGRIDEFMLAIGPEAGLLLRMLVLASGATRCLEVGTSVGYSTIWIASAMQATGGRIVTLDVSENKHRQARENLGRAGFAELVELRTGDALESIAALEGPFDFVLLDVGRQLYLPAYEAILPKLAPGAIVVADNMTYPTHTMDIAEAYQARVRGTPGMESLLLTIGNGIELSRYQPSRG